MNDGCFSHEITWYGDNLECPLCKLENLFTKDEQTKYIGYVVHEIIVKTIADWQDKKESE